MLIAPGRNVRCTKAIACICGCAKATEGAIYMCEDLQPTGLLHDIYCTTDECDGAMILLKGKEHFLCACRFVPLDDGDTSLVKEEAEAGGDHTDQIHTFETEDA